MAGNATGLDTAWGQAAADRLGALEMQFNDVFQRAKAIVAETPQHWYGNDCLALINWFNGEGKRILDNVTVNVNDARTALSKHTQNQEHKSSASSTVGR